MFLTDFLIKHPGLESLPWGAWSVPYIPFGDAPMSNPAEPYIDSGVRMDALESHLLNEAQRAREPGYAECQRAAAERTERIRRHAWLGRVETHIGNDIEDDG